MIGKTVICSENYPERREIKYMKTLGLYLHIPFCISKCAYCDFYSIPGTSESMRQRYIDAMISHMHEYSVQAKDYVVTTIYFGGGTPSLMTGEQVKMIMKKIKSYFRVASNCEVSMELNPKTADFQKLKHFRKAGINRLSIGVQSFNEQDVRVCGRPHKASDSFEVFTAARKAGFNNISFDLMYGLPGQTLQSVIDNINTAIKLEPEHISLYGLKVEEGTPFWFDRHSLAFPDEDTERSMYFNCVGLMAVAGYKQYEISNFSKKGRQCRHNLKYWNCDEYLGFGPGAHSYFAGKRFSLKKNIGLYIDSFNPEKQVEEKLVDEYIDIPYSSRVAEYVMLRFRLTAGINCSTFRKKFGRNFEDIYLNRITPYINSGHIVKTKKGYAFTPAGMYVSNYILARVVDFDLIIPGT